MLEIKNKAWGRQKREFYGKRATMISPVKKKQK